MAVPTFQQLSDPTQGGPGFGPQSLAQRLLLIFSMIASGQNPDGSPGSFSGTVVAPAPTGNAATDMGNVQAAINSLPRGIGTVLLQAGVYAMSSISNTDTVSVTISTNTWTDASATNAYIGRYVLARTGNTRVPKIVGVTPGVGFTTDINSGATIASGSAQIVQPALVVPYGTAMQGIGRFSTQQFGSPTLATAQPGTLLLDGGNGVTILSVGSPTFGGDGIYLSRMGIWGGAGNGVAGNTFCGVYLGDNNWFAELERVDLSWHGTAGMILDANLNSLDSRNSSYQNNGTAGATTPTGGVLTNYYQNQTSACINFYNDFMFGNFGMGIGGGAILGGIGKVMSFMNGQIANTFQTSFSPYSGYGLVIDSRLSGAQANVVNAWIGTNGLGDLWLNNGVLEVINSTLTTSVAGPVVNFANLSLRGCHLFSSSAIAVQNNGIVNWSACELANPGVLTNLYTGGPNVQQSLNSGSSQYFGVLAKAASYTILTTDPTTVVFTVAAGQTATVPSAAVAGTGTRLVLANANASTSTLALAATAGTLPVASLAAGTAVTLVSDGTNWQRGA